MQLQQMQHDKKTHAIEKFREGCTWEEVAKAIDVHRTTLWRWAQADVEFGEAIKEAGADPDLDVEAITYQNAVDPDPANNTLRMFWLKNRIPQKYKDRLDVTTRGGAKFETFDDQRDPDLPPPAPAA